jgi:hypothetical protein
VAIRDTHDSLLFEVPTVGTGLLRDTHDSLLFEVPTVGTGLLRDTHDSLLFEVPIPTVTLVYPLTPPAIAGIGPQDFTLGLNPVVGESDSPFTQSDQVFQWPGDMWTIEANLPPMLFQQAEQWITFLESLFGKYGTFLMGDYNRPTPQGAWSGSPVVNGSNPSRSNTLNLRGATPSIALYGVAGDYLQVTAGAGMPQRLYKVMQTAPSSSGGDVALTVRPNLRETLSDGTAIVTANCAGTFRLAANPVLPKIGKNREYTISFKAREALLP